ncbi:MAG TPA: metallophosphoesterase family protein [Chitinispirillaceae bacterium]|nr:metallophosphoesterase family protein [Chitinispirillaceae bacterium]
MYLEKQNRRSEVRKTEQVKVREDGSYRLIIVSDTHSAPHVRAIELITSLRPDAILHAGDVGELGVLDQLNSICPVYAVRGNIDQRLPLLSDVLVLEIISKEGLVLRILALHVGLYGPKLRADAARKAKAEAASLIVCGHSHVPFIGIERGLAVFNPGSMGPRRNGLPIVFGMLELSAGDFRLSHIDCETGLTWRPPKF